MTVCPSQTQNQLVGSDLQPPPKGACPWLAPPPGLLGVPDLLAAVKGWRGCGGPWGRAGFLAWTGLGGLSAAPTPSGSDPWPLDGGSALGRGHSLPPGQDLAQCLLAPGLGQAVITALGQLKAQWTHSGLFFLLLVLTCSQRCPLSSMQVTLGRSSGPEGFGSKAVAQVGPLCFPGARLQLRPAGTPRPMSSGGLAMSPVTEPSASGRRPPTPRLRRTHARLLLLVAREFSARGPPAELRCGRPRPWNS